MWYKQDQTQIIAVPDHTVRLLLTSNEMTATPVQSTQTYAKGNYKNGKCRYLECQTESESIKYIR